MATTWHIQKTIALCCNKFCGTIVRSKFNYFGSKSFLQYRYLSDKKMLCKRQYSSRPRELNFLSDIEEYIERDFVLNDLKKKLDEENLPALVTTSSLLEKCQNIDDVLLEVQNAVRGGKLWKDELVLYINALVKVKQSNSNQPRSVDDSINLTRENRLQLMGDLKVDNASIIEQRKLLNDPYFQYLVKEVLLHSSRFTTFDLSFVFLNFVMLRIPSDSAVMSILVTILQRRINEFFPSDVTRCIMAINMIAHQQSVQIGSLYDGLFMHLENQAIDDPTFVRILTQTTLIHQIKLLRYAGSLASPNLRSTIYYSIVESVKRRRDIRFHNIQEATAILLALATTRIKHPNFILGVAAKYFTENEGSLNTGHRILIRTCLRKLRLSDSRPLQQMLAISQE
ncbi:uncharacterized protein LOC144422010 [Styela clava]